MNQPETKPLYTLTFFNNGRAKDATATTDVKRARDLYQEQYNNGGQLPRLNVNGRDVGRAEANRLMRLKRWPLARKKQPYVNRPEKKPKTP